MAVTLDADLGTAGGSLSGSTTWDLVTANAVAAGAKIVLVIGGFSGFSGGVLSVAGGGLTWTLDLDFEGYLFAAIASASAPAGLAASTTITVTLDASMAPCLISGSSYLGVDTAAAVVDTGSSETGSSSWSAPPLTVGVGDLVIGGCFGSGNGTSTSTPDIGTELHDFTSQGQDELTSLYAVAAYTSVTVSGTWSGTPSANVAVAAAYRASSPVPTIRIVSSPQRW